MFHVSLRSTINFIEGVIGVPDSTIPDVIYLGLYVVY